MKIGFEFEFSSPLSFWRVKNQLRKELGDKSYDRVVSHVTADYSIRGPIDNEQIELVTNPLPRRDAYRILDVVLNWLDDKGAVTNRSTGLHANYSDLRVQHNLNPVSILTTIPAKQILSEFNRAHNKYCRPWEYYLNHIKKETKRLHRYKKEERMMVAAVGKKTTANEIDFFVTSATKFMHWAKAGCEINNYSFTDKANRSMHYKFDVKRCNLNIGYLYDRGYIESRMIGGNYLAKKDLVVERVEDVEAGLLMACDQKYNVRKNYNYLKEFYLT